MIPDATRVLAVDGALDLRLSLRLLRMGNDASLDLGTHDVRWALQTPEGPATLEAHHQGDALALRSWGPGAQAVLDQAPDLLGLSDDPSGFRPDHPVVQRLQARFSGLRLVRLHDVAHVLVPVICQQLVTWREATTTWRRIVLDHGEPAPGPYDLRCAPTADALQRAPSWSLERAGLNRQRAQTVKRVATYARRLTEVMGDVAALRQRWRALPGLGP